MVNVVAKYDDLYPSRSDEIYLGGGLALIKTNKIGICFNCKCETYWMDGDFNAYLCSEECKKEILTKLSNNGRKAAEIGRSFK